MELIAANVIVLLAASIHACTGFGFSLLATPFLLLVFAPSDAIQINIALSIVISVLLMPKLVADLDRALLGRLILGSLLGAPVGILVYLFADPDQLRVAIGLLLLVLTFFILRKFRFARSARKDVLTGGFSGALTSGLGMPGPPLMVYFAGTSIRQSVLRSTTLVCFLITYSLSLALQIGFGSSSWEVLRAALYLLPATVAGVVIGQRLFARIDAAQFMKLLYGLLILTGAYLTLGSVLPI
ncbi:sulfite exporter TauE/SafE family protein [Oceanibium sediminis]|uniref:sulfite exporter TauE/SafE family protein n=1 Tax=Oceanibium sediminis TaxID=2026339 RepID=UPI000DD3E1CD|nr:sulfite exporter TauE/SafE family protein [Oceanibium sediminis]